MALGQISKWYKIRSLQQSTKGFTIPFITFEGKPDQQFIVDLKLGLRLRLPDIVDQLISDTAHLEFGSLIRDLSVTDKVITPASQPTNPVTPILGTDTVRLIENQKELNLIKQVKWDNTKLRDRKRKSEIQFISFDNFKRREQRDL